jgi:hypothetical protein
MSQIYFKISVETYNGHKGAERPVAFKWKDRRIECKEIKDRWYGEDHEYFKITGDDGRTYILRYDRKRDFWEIQSLEA